MQEKEVTLSERMKTKTKKKVAGREEG